MSSHVVKQTLFRGELSSDPGLIVKRKPVLELKPPSDKPLKYSVLTQSRADLSDPHNSPSVSMWDYLLASAQTQRLNEISIYVGHGTTAEALRLLYLNDAALNIWQEMKKPVKIMGRLHRPPRGTVLSFGMPFSE